VISSGKQRNTNRADVEPALAGLRRVRLINWLVSKHAEIKRVGVRRRFPLIPVELALLSLCLYTPTAAQSKRPAPSGNNPISATKSISDGDLSSDDDDDVQIGQPEAEMKARRAIMFQEKEYKDNVARAREVAKLGSDLQQSFKDRNALDRNDDKKLERLEKLTKKIRSQAGGSDDEEATESQPESLEVAVADLADSSQSLCKGVEATPRQVVSAAVISQANKLLELIHLVRTMIAKPFK
jgi:hypothetical protein